MLTIVHFNLTKVLILEVQIKENYIQDIKSDDLAKEQSN